ncbi:guanylate cyclase 32E [Caerostris extrusa]|uniref:Guanylate cyclase 32E n=1 Tax=Caerostris extrusa TaxID=172846 RepID=A0AAV4RI98_CAEEX|nr:guanylate cyclase 32E [Caerostris extrusa]
MQEKGLLDTGDYVVISIEAQEFYDPSKEYQYIRRDFEASWMVADPIPFRSVLLLSPVEVPIYAGLAYDAVMIYASALTDALADNVSVRNGPEVFQYLKSRNYESKKMRTF